jgi:hypothetical protein
MSGGPPPRARRTSWVHRMSKNTPEAWRPNPRPYRLRFDTIVSIVLSFRQPRRFIRGKKAQPRREALGHGASGLRAGRAPRTQGFAARAMHEPFARSTSASRLAKTARAQAFVIFAAHERLAHKKNRSRAARAARARPKAQKPRLSRSSGRSTLQAAPEKPDSASPASRQAGASGFIENWTGRRPPGPRTPPSALTEGMRALRPGPPHDTPVVRLAVPWPKYFKQKSPD